VLVADEMAHLTVNSCCLNKLAFSYALGTDALSCEFVGTKPLIHNAHFLVQVNKDESNNAWCACEFAGPLQ